MHGHCKASDYNYTCKVYALVANEYSTYTVFTKWVLMHIAYMNIIGIYMNSAKFHVCNGHIECQICLCKHCIVSDMIEVGGKILERRLLHELFMSIIDEFEELKRDFQMLIRTGVNGLGVLCGMHGRTATKAPQAKLYHFFFSKSEIWNGNWQSSHYHASG